MRNIDLAIVGAGFAGLTCAEAAAARGLDTVILERKKDPASAIHTTGILVKEIADLWDFPRDLTRKLKGVRLYGPSLDSLDLHSPGYYFLATDTPTLMQWMSDRAVNAGAEIRFKSSFKGLQQETDHIQLPDQNLSSQFLVAADGARSRVAKHMELGLNQKFLYGIEAEYINIDGVDPEHMHVFLDSEIAPGYIAWLVPGVQQGSESSAHFQLGLASNNAACLDLNKLVQQLQKIFDFKHAKLTSRRGGLIPCGGPVHPFAKNNVMLLGDAAGMVSPVTAGGIHPAMQLGRHAGIAISDFLFDQGPAPHKVIKQQRSNYRIKKLLRNLYDRYPLSNKNLDKMLESRIFRSVAQTIFFHNRGLFSARAWSEILHLRKPERSRA